MRASFITAILALAVLALLAACSPLLLLDSFTSNRGYARTADVPYADRERQKLDIYAPASADGKTRRPVVVFFYGGGWETGRRERYRFVGQALTNRGFVAVLPDYRVYPDVVFPEFVADGARAVRWTKSNIAAFGGDPERIFIMGHSAGAHIAAMLALDPQYLKSVSLAPQNLRGVIGLAGPYDFLPLRSERLERIFGPEAGRWRSQPINFVDGRNPPMLLMTGDEDTAVLPRNTHRLAAKIRANGGAVRTIEYPGVGHAELVARLAAPLRGDGEVLNAIAAFVNEQAEQTTTPRGETAGRSTP